MARPDADRNRMAKSLCQSSTEADCEVVCRTFPVWVVVPRVQVSHHYRGLAIVPEGLSRFASSISEEVHDIVQPVVNWGMARLV